MYSNGESIKFRIYSDVRSTSALTQGYAFVNHQGGMSEIPFNDFWLNIPLYRTHHIMEYVDVQKDGRIQPIERQEINPFYLEYSFFNDITRNKINNGSELTEPMIFFIRSKRSDLQEMTDEDVRSWFDYVGKNELPWTSSDGTLITIDEIESSHVILTSIVSKAKLLNITINK